MSLILESLLRTAVTDPSRIALDPLIEGVVTYAELSDGVDVLAAEWRRACKPGRPIAIQLDQGVDLAMNELALLEAQIPVLSLPRFFTVEQSRHAITECGAVALGLDRHPQEGTASCRTAPSHLPRGTARVTFTSGSTGTPKGICLSADHMLTVARSVIEGVGSDHAGRHLALLPPGILLETVAGFFATLLAGGTYVCPPQAYVGLADPFAPDFAKMANVIAEAQITSLIVVPEYLAGLTGLLEATDLRLRRLTIVAVGGAHVSPALLARAQAVGLPVRQGYGLTEFGSVVALQQPGDAPGSVGRPLKHCRATVAEDGEIMLDGPTHLGIVGASRDQGPLATGDIGRIDDAGRLWIEGRKSNVIITSFGRNVSPEWVEQALFAQPEIAQAMVYGDGLPAPEALLVPARSDADLEQAVARANATLPAYAKIASWREAAFFMRDKGQVTGNGRLRRDAITAAYLNGEPDFFTVLEADTVRERLAFLSIAQVEAGLRGDIDRSAYVAYLTQAWHHVRHTVPLMQAALVRLGHRPELVTALDDYIAEEAGHDEWILADIAAAGGDAEAVRESRPARATKSMIEHAYSEVSQGNPVSLFGMIYVLESISVALAQRGATALAGTLGLPPQAFTYLTSHGALDQDHLRFFARLVNDMADPGDRAAITRMAKDTFALYGAVFASIELEAADVVA